MKGILVFVFCGLAALPCLGGMVFEKTLVEVRPAPDAEVVTADFPFEVKGEKAVQIRMMDSNCSCLGAEINGDGKLLWQPGEKGTIRGVFELGTFKGTTDKAVSIYLKGDAPGKPSVNLVVRVHIPVLFKVSEKTNRWVIGGAKDEKVVTMKVQHDQPIKVTGVDGTNDNFTFELETVKEGWEYRLRVTPKDVSAPAYGIVRVRTDCPIKRHASHQVFFVVSKAKKKKEQATGKAEEKK